MTRQQTLGLRIRNFRERAKISQFNLELEIEASPGYLSRVENGLINPDKESVMKIANVLRLRDSEIDYLIGKIFYPATQEEIDLAINEVKDYFSQKGVLAYLIDDRSRFIYVSDAFMKIMNVDLEERSKLILRPFIDIILDPQLKLIDYLSKKNRYSALETLLVRLNYESGYMLDDPIFIQTKKIIENNDITKDMWKRVVRENIPFALQSEDSRRVIFNFNGMEVPLVYSDHILLNYKRFEVVQYSSSNLIINLLSKLM